MVPTQMNDGVLCHRTPEPRGLVAALGEAWVIIADVVRRWRFRARSRAELAVMSDRDLRDIGLSRADANREGRKAFWKR